MDTAHLDSSDPLCRQQYKGDYRVIGILPENRGSKHLVFKRFDMVKRFPYFLGFSVRQQKEIKCNPEWLGKSRGRIFSAGVQLVISAIPGIRFNHFPPASPKVNRQDADSRQPDKSQSHQRRGQECAAILRHSQSKIIKR